MINLYIKIKNTQIALILQGLMCFMLFSCGSDDPDNLPVARFKSTYLSRKELKSFIPNGLSLKDSLRVSKMFIEQWIQEQALMEEAFTKVDKIDEKIQSKVEDYKRKLAILELKNSMATNIDTIVNEAEIKAVYDEQKASFISQETYYSY